MAYGHTLFLLDGEALDPLSRLKKVYRLERQSCNRFTVVVSGSVLMGSVSVLMMGVSVLKMVA